MTRSATSTLSTILAKSYRSFSELEQDVDEYAAVDGFVVVKYNTSYSKEKVIQRGNFRCHKNGMSKKQMLTRHLPSLSALSS